MANISINAETCIRCGKCVRVCPSAVFAQETPKSDVEVKYPDHCIVCGHCAAVCPTGSVEHADFPADKVHAIDRSALPSPGQVMLLLRSRRSNRAFLPSPVPEELLSQILEAAHRAPTASNMQQVEFTLITDPEKLREISAATISTFASIAKRVSNPLIKPIVKLIAPQVMKMVPRFRMLEHEFSKGKDRILRGATAVIFIHTPESNRFGVEDSNLAYQNASIMAESLGVSQFYTGFVYSAIKQDAKRFAAFIPKGRRIHAGIALGMPAFLYPNYIDKKDPVVTEM